MPVRIGYIQAKFVMTSGDIATHDDQPQRSSFGVLVRFMQDVAEDHRDGQHQERRHGGRVEEVHLPVDVGEPRQKARAVADEDRGVAPVAPDERPPHRPAEHRHRDEPHRRRADEHHRLHTRLRTAAGHVLVVDRIQHRPQRHRPGPRLGLPRMVVAVGVGQPGVESVGRIRVMPQRAHRVRQRQDAVLADRLAHLVPVDSRSRRRTTAHRTPGRRRTESAPVHTPPDPGRGATRPAHGRSTRYCRRAATSNASVITPKNTTKYSPDHFVAQANPSSTPAPNRHHRTPSRGPHGVSAMRPSSSATCNRSRTWSRSTISAPNAATTNTVRKPSSSAVRDATKLTPSAIEQQPGDPADQRRAAHPPRDPDHQHHQDDAAHRAGEPPAQPVVAEQRLADRDQLLADRRMHHQPVAGVVLHAVVVQYLPGLRRVVLLVEDRGAGVGRRAEVEETRHRRQRRDDRGHRPALQPVNRPEVGDGHQRRRADDGDRAPALRWRGRSRL